VDITISPIEFRFEYYADVYNLMRSAFSFKNINELDSLCDNRTSIEKFWAWINDHNTIGKLFSREIKKVETSLNKVDFVVYLINYKNE